MFDIEKKLKEVFEKYIPTVLEALEKNKKKDFVLDCLKNQYSYHTISQMDETQILAEVMKAYEAYDKFALQYNKLKK